MTKIKESTKEVTIYTVAGKQFLNKTDALDYENELTQKMDYVYYVVMYDPARVNSLKKNKEPNYTKWIVYAVPAHHTPTNLIYDVLINNIGPAITQHIDEYEIKYGYINNWDLRQPKRFYSIDAIAEFFNHKISDKGYPTIQFLNESGACIEEWKRDGVDVKQK